MFSRSIYVIIVAAGSGSRFGTERPKQFLPLGDSSVLRQAIAIFAGLGCGVSLTVVTSRQWIGSEEVLPESTDGLSSFNVATGGATRWESVKRGLDTLPPFAPGDIVLVHDAARPLTPVHVVEEVIKAIDAGHQGAIPAIEVTDSMRMLLDDDTERSVPLDRSRIRCVQTPQAFDASLLRDAYSRPWSPAFTDDASVMDAAGYSDIVLTAGHPDNIKITHPGDLKRAEEILHAHNISR